MFRLLSRLNILWFAPKKKKKKLWFTACLLSYYFILSLDNRLSVLWFTTKKMFCNWYTICEFLFFYFQFQYMVSVLGTNFLSLNQVSMWFIMHFFFFWNLQCPFILHYFIYLFGQNDIFRKTKRYWSWLHFFILLVLIQVHATRHVKNTIKEHLQ